MLSKTFLTQEFLLDTCCWCCMALPWHQHDLTPTYASRTKNVFLIKPPKYSRRIQFWCWISKYISTGICIVSFIWWKAHVNLYTWIFHVRKSATEFHRKILGRKCYTWKILVPAGENGREQESWSIFGDILRSFVIKGRQGVTYPGVRNVHIFRFGYFVWSFQSWKGYGQHRRSVPAARKFPGAYGPGVGETRN